MREGERFHSPRVPPKYVIISTGDTGIPRPREEFDQNVSRYSHGMPGEVRAAPRHAAPLLSPLLFSSFSSYSFLPFLAPVEPSASSCRLPFAATRIRFVAPPLRRLPSSLCPRLHRIGYNKGGESVGVLGVRTAPVRSAVPRTKSRSRRCAEREISGLRRSFSDRSRARPP